MFRRANNRNDASKKLEVCRGNKEKLDLLLRRAAYHNDLLTAQLALESGADPNNQNLLGESAWQRALEKGEIAMVRLFLGHGASLSADKFGIPPLVHAIRASRVDVAEELMEAGADVNERENTTLQTPLHEAAIRPECLNILKALLKPGADPRMTDCAGDDPLVHAKFYRKQFGDVDPRAFRLLQSALAKWKNMPPPKRPRRRAEASEQRLARRYLFDKP